MTTTPILKYLNRSLAALLLLLSATRASAQRSLFTDKPLYLAGERLHVSLQFDDPSRVAYIELADSCGMVAQTMTPLTDGQGWASIALPTSLHSGHYLLSAYTRAQLPAALQKIVAVVNPESVTTADDILFLPPETAAQQPATTYKPSQRVAVALPRDSALTIRTLTVLRAPLVSNTDAFGPAAVADCDARPSRQLPASPMELEGHIVMARPAAANAPAESKLVLIGKGADVYDGQPQPDGTWLYYTAGIHEALPTLLNGYSADAQPVAMQFVSPYAAFVPRQLPPLQVRCSRDELLERSRLARQESAFANWLSADTVPHSLLFFSRPPAYYYNMDEYTRMNSIDEALLEFVSGIRKRRINNVTQLCIHQVDRKEFSRLPALVLLDGMPINDVENLLKYDARLLQYVQIYTDTYTFGNTIYDGAILFISKKGRMSNYKLDKGNSLVSYAFPQLRHAFRVPDNAPISTVGWLPAVNASRAEFPAPQFSGRYTVLLQGTDASGQPFQSQSEIIVSE